MEGAAGKAEGLVRLARGGRGNSQWGMQGGELLSTGS